jgi:hypothetical protein
MGKSLIPKMDPTVKLRWVRALRSGEYRQGSESFLRVVGKNGDRSYCCFGVLCELYLREYPNYFWESPDYSKGEIADTLFGIPNVLPVPVFKWARLGTSIGPVLGYDKEDIITLAVLNDKGYSFQSLADIIEEHL